MRPARLLFALPLIVTPLGVAGWLWLTLLSPWTYERPGHLASIAQGPHQVFVYGTLRHAPVRWLVYGRTGEPETATLPGYRRTGLDLEPAPDAQVDGLLLTVDASELARLDRYERLGLRYVRVRVTLDDGRQAWAYRRLETWIR